MTFPVRYWTRLTCPQEHTWQASFVTWPRDPLHGYEENPLPAVWFDRSYELICQICRMPNLGFHRATEQYAQTPHVAITCRFCEARPVIAPMQCVTETVYEFKSGPRVRYSWHIPASLVLMACGPCARDPRIFAETAKNHPGFSYFREDGDNYSRPGSGPKNDWIGDIWFH